MSVPQSDAAGSADRAEWYSEGLKFGCTQCGNCCTGPPGAVWFTREEGMSMAAELGLDEKTFLKQYAHKIDGNWSLIERKTSHGYDCVFLDRKTTPGKATCSIYGGRPMQCRTWPFWAENLTSERAWEGVKRRTPCPGMGTGNLVPIEKIRIQRDAMDERFSQ